MHFSFGQKLKLLIVCVKKVKDLDDIRGEWVMKIRGKVQHLNFYFLSLCMFFL